MSSAVKKSGIPAYRLNQGRNQDIALNVVYHIGTERFKFMNGEVCVFYLLSGFECDVIVLSSIVWINFCKVKSLREEIVNQRTKCNTIGPITCKVFKFDLKLYHSKLFF